MCGTKKNILPGPKIKLYWDQWKRCRVFPEFDGVISLTLMVSKWSLSYRISQFIIFIVISCNARTKTHKEPFKNRDLHVIKINFLIPTKSFAYYFISFVLKSMFHCASCTELIALSNYIFQNAEDHQSWLMY